MRQIAPQLNKRRKYVYFLMEILYSLNVRWNTSFVVIFYNLFHAHVVLMPISEKTWAQATRVNQARGDIIAREQQFFFNTRQRNI